MFLHIIYKPKQANFGKVDFDYKYIVYSHHSAKILEGIQCFLF